MNNKHKHQLEKIVSSLYGIEESLDEVRWVMVEGIWVPEGRNYSTFPDIILVYDYHAVPIEYKATRKEYFHALEQLDAGKHFIQKELKRDCRYGKFVWTPNLYYERIELK